MRLVAIACFAIACARSKKPLSDEEHEVRAVEQAIAKLSSPHIDERASGALGVATACCSFDADKWRPARALARPQACAALEPLLRVEENPRVLDAAMTNFSSGHCEVTLSWELLLKRCEQLPPEPVGNAACIALQNMEPTREAASAIVGLAKRHIGDRSMRTWLLIALAEMGEQELGIVVPLTIDPDPRVREMGVETLSHALTLGPLDLPEALRALEHLSKDPDQDLASYAEVIAEEYRQKATLPDATVDRLAKDGLRDGELHMLAVRRFSCKAQNAKPLLERLAAGKDGSAVVARRALAIRAKRCGD